jgi:hypothetical protein
MLAWTNTHYYSPLVTVDLRYRMQQEYQQATFYLWY